MSIGIIGAGQMGMTLARQFTMADHSVNVTNSTGAGKLKALASETGAVAVSLNEVVNDTEVVILAVPLMAVTQLPKQLFKNVSAIVVDVCNYYPIRDGSIDEIENGMPESVWVTRQIQYPVIKAYNTILAGSLIQSGLPQGASGRIALSVSGDSKGAKNTVVALINDSGFDAVDIGSLQDSWRQQPGSPVYCTDLTIGQLEKSVLRARNEVLSQRRELALQFILKQDQEKWLDWWKQCRDNNRRVYESIL